jgi:hypothetical protein
MGRDMAPVGYCFFPILLLYLHLSDKFDTSPDWHNSDNTF